MKKTCKRYTPEFKFQVVLEVLKEEKTMNEIASDHGIHATQIRQW
ncbi:transposase [Pseudogracilibacillus sp. SO30301A]